MNPDDPTDIIAPRDQGPYEAVDIIRAMLQGAYVEGATLTYYDFLLDCCGTGGGYRVWEVYTEEERYVETLNLDAYRTASEVLEQLDEIAAYDPADHEEWTSR